MQPYIHQLDNPKPYTPKPEPKAKLDVNLDRILTALQSNPYEPL